MSYGKVKSDMVLKACEKTIVWIANDRKLQMSFVDEHNNLIAEYPWYLRLLCWLFVKKWTGEWIKHLHWTQERTCCKMFKLAKSSSVVYISADDAEMIGLHNVCDDYLDLIAKHGDEDVNQH